MGREILSLPAPGADERIAYGPDASHFGDLRRPLGDGPHLIVVVVHGGSWRAQYSLEHIGHLCAALTREGFATWSLEYRRLGQEGGGWPGTFQDLAQGVNALRDVAGGRDLDLSRTVCIGHSAGGHLAFWLAGRSRIPDGDPLHDPSPLPLLGAVSLAGSVDLRRGSELRLSNGAVDELLGGSAALVHARLATASPYELLPLGVPQVLIHGEQDDIVPIEISRRYRDEAARLGEPVELVELENAGHFEVIDPRTDAWPAVLGAVQRLMAAADG